MSGTDVLRTVMDAIGRLSANDLETVKREALALIEQLIRCRESAMASQAEIISLEVAGIMAHHVAMLAENEQEAAAIDEFMDRMHQGTIIPASPVNH
jgi:hypothetical protein